MYADGWAPYRCGSPSSCPATRTSVLYGSTLGARAGNAELRGMRHDVVVACAQTDVDADTERA